MLNWHRQLARAARSMGFRANALRPGASSLKSTAPQMNSLPLCAVAPFAPQSMQHRKYHAPTKALSALSST
eukprot:CAMPEP_0198128494 /NCGR_PEP_ID=MMETSP1442-20131203/49507_1 /TAXON_ID= /ORGANISM="Craspedostauros australis, Strain CCMP3328" /LENGTH=70 /DNA_ID=CAMNT_0043788671 /DNA_START=94 /DNA_END=302 /DNA_ORIENTATION=-